MALLASLIQGLFFRTTPENPSFDLNSAEAWDAFDAGPRSGAGVPVNEQTANTYAPWFRGIKMISGDVGKLPLNVYKRNGTGKDKATDHPVFKLIRYRPNEYMTANKFREAMTGNALVKGNGYAYIERDGAGVPLALLWLDPDKVTPVIANGDLWYVVNVLNENRRIDPSSILHIKGFSRDGICGYSVVDKARESLGLGIAAQRYSAVQLKNGGRPGVVLEVPGTMQPQAIAAFRQSWETMHAGIDNAHKTAILTNGMKANALSFSNEDAQLIEERQFQVRDVANWLGVPPHKLGDNSRTAYASLEQENQSYLDDALDYWLSTWESECRDKLLTEDEKNNDTHIVEFMRSALVRADFAGRMNGYRVMLAGQPFATVNEVRAMENLNPIEGGDVITKPLNMSDPGGKDNEPDDPAVSNVKPKGPNSGSGGSISPKRAALEDGVHGILARDQRRAIRRIATHAEKAARSPKTFLAWLDNLDADHGPAIRDILEPAYVTFHAAYEMDHNDGAVTRFIDAVRQELLELSGNARPSQLVGEIQRWAEAKEKIHGSPIP